MNYSAVYDIINRVLTDTTNPYLGKSPVVCISIVPWSRLSGRRRTQVHITYKNGKTVSAFTVS